MFVKELPAHHWPSQAFHDYPYLQVSGFYLRRKNLDPCLDSELLQIGQVRPVSTKTHVIKFWSLAGEATGRWQMDTFKMNNNKRTLLFVWVFCLLSVYHHGAWCPEALEEGIGSPGTRGRWFWVIMWVLEPEPTSSRKKASDNRWAPSVGNF